METDPYILCIKKYRRKEIDMKSTCGTDIIEIERIKNSIVKYGERFLNTVFTENEIKYCESKKGQKYQHYAARFAAKEAVYKALSNNINAPDEWKNIEILSENNGRPKVNLKIEVKNLESIDISLSHCKLYAVANVVANLKEE